MKFALLILSVICGMLCIPNQTQAGCPGGVCPLSQRSRVSVRVSSVPTMTTTSRTVASSSYVGYNGRDYINHKQRHQRRRNSSSVSFYVR